jgi:hypothetical protein
MMTRSSLFVNDCKLTGVVRFRTNRKSRASRDHVLAAECRGAFAVNLCIIRCFVSGRRRPYMAEFHRRSNRALEHDDAKKHPLRHFPTESMSARSCEQVTERSQANMVWAVLKFGRGFRSRGHRLLLFMQLPSISWPPARRDSIGSAHRLVSRRQRCQSSLIANIAQIKSSANARGDNNKTFCFCKEKLILQVQQIGEF